MSIGLMNAVWSAKLAPTRKLVLLAICDHANDVRECFPKTKTIAEKCSLSVRAVFIALAELESGNYLSREYRAGRSTVYRVTDPCTWCIPAPDAHLHDVHTGMHDVHTHPAPRAVYITITEPSPNQTAQSSAKAPVASPAVDTCLADQNGKVHDLFNQHPDGNSKPSSAHQPPATGVNRKSTAAKVPIAQGRFGEFWAAWPAGCRKVARKTCSDFWARNHLDDQADQILADVIGLKTSKSWQNGFDPAPRTYLNQRRWEDHDADHGALATRDWT